MKFYSSIAPFYEDIFPLNLAQVKFINEALNNSTSVNILDVGCGVGTLIKELSKEHSKLYGIDLDAEMIALAKQRSYKGTPQIKVGNMLQLNKQFTSNQFDAIVCFGNTLVHLPELSDVNEFINQAFSCLKKGGKLLLQIINYDRILDQQIDSLPTIDKDKVNFIRNYEFLKDVDKINFVTKLTIKENNQVVENEQLLIPIKKDKLLTMLKAIGFTCIATFGGFNRSPLKKDSVPLVIEALK